MKKSHEDYTIGENEGIPSMRLAVTGACNLKCSYCPIDGDNYLLKGRKFLTTNDFITVSRIAYNNGFRHFSITGGEPLAIPDATFRIAQAIRELPNLGYLRLNTNGLAIIENLERIKEVDFDKVKVSLDSLRIGKYQGNNKGKKQYEVSQVLEGVELLRDLEIPIRINMVVGRFNIDEVPEMIDYSKEKGLELKLFDITFYRDAITSDPHFWKDNYVSLNPLIEQLNERFGAPRIVYAVGGFGNPMPVFNPDSDSPIRVRTSEEKARYVEECVNCADYMCQDGFCNLTLTTDGDLKTCRPEGLDFDLKLTDREGNLLPEEQISERLQRAIGLFKTSKEKGRTLDEMITSWKTL